MRSPTRLIAAPLSHAKVFGLSLVVGLLAAGLVPGNAADPAPSAAADFSSPPVQTNDVASTTAESLAAYKRMSLEDLMNQDVTSVARAPEPYLQAPAALQVITGEEIHRFGASSLPEALRLADNLDVAQATSSTWDISARGFNTSNPNKLLVLMDGRTLYTPLLSGVIWNMQDYLLADLDRIEVISGPGGTLWGANAVNGVINIVTKDARDTQGLYAEAGGGTWLQDFVGVRYGTALASNVYARVYGKYFDRGPQVYADGSSAHDAWNRGQGGFRLDSQAAPQDHLTLEGDAFAGGNDVVPGGEGTPRFRGNASNAHVLGRWTHLFAEDSDLSLQLYYDRTHLAVPFQSAGTIPAGTLHDTIDTYDLDFQHRFPLGERQHIIWGLGYRFTHDRDRAAPIVAFLPPTFDQNLYSAFAQDEIELRPDLFFTLGSKLEHNDYTGFEYEPSARLQWNATSRQMVWAAVSRAVRTPARYDRDLFEPSPAYGTLLVGNDTFESEDVIAYELGYRAQLSSQVAGSLSTFFNDYEHLRSLNLRNGTTLPAIWENNLRGQTYGFELSVNYRPLSWWNLRAGYDLLKEHITVGPGGDLSNGLNETADPQQQVFLRSAMDLPGHTELAAAFRWIDTVHNNNGPISGVIPSYAELDMRFAWHATRHLEFSLVGQNLLHDQHAEAGFPGPAQEQLVRSMYGQVTFTW